MTHAAPPWSVSVVVPVFNASATVAAAVRSVLDQRVPAALAHLREVVVVDDASTEAAPPEDPAGPLAAALASVGDPRVRRVRRATNGGPAAARTRGVAETTGDLLAFVDADDLWLPGKLEAQCRALRDAPHAGVAYGWVDVVDEAGAVVQADQRATHSGDVYAHLLRANFIYSGSNVVVRRPVFDAVGGFDVRLRAVEDWELHTRLARATPFACVPRVLVHYRRHPRSLTRQFDVMERAFRTASEAVYAGAPPRLRPLRESASAEFYAHLARRARSGRPRAWRPALRYAALASWHRLRALARGRPGLASGPPRPQRPPSPPP